MVLLEANAMIFLDKPGVKKKADTADEVSGQYHVNVEFIESVEFIDEFC